MTVKVGDRVRLGVPARYLWGFTGEVLAVEGEVATVQLDRATGVGLPGGFPAGAPVQVYVEGLEKE